VVFPACGEASEILQPSEGPLDFPAIFVMRTVSLREVSQRLVLPFDEWTDQADPQAFESLTERITVGGFVIDQTRSSRQTDRSARDQLFDQSDLVG